MKGGLLLCALLAVVGAKAQDITFCGESVPTDRKSVNNSLISAINRNQKEFKNKALQAKIDLYLPFFSIILKQYGLPDDLKFIAVAESRLQRNVESGAGAAGVWQFMPLTASGMGLPAAERNAVIKSTHAACRLLGKLYRQLNNWALVAAAYNYGIGNLSKAITRQGTRDYYALHLNPETANYVYQILSFKILYTRQEIARGKVAVFDSTPIKPPVIHSPTAMPALPSLPAAPGWQKSGFSSSLAIATPGKEDVPQMPIGVDTLAVPAAIVKDSYLNTSEALAFNTTDDLQVNGFLLKANTVIKGVVYSHKGNRARIAIEGIDVAPQLKDYSGEVFAGDGLNGLPHRVTKGAMVFNAGERVHLKFIRE